MTKHTKLWEDVILTKNKAQTINYSEALYVRLVNGRLPNKCANVKRLLIDAIGEVWHRTRSCTPLSIFDRL